MYVYLYIYHTTTICVMIRFTAIIYDTVVCLGYMYNSSVCTYKVFACTGI